MRSSLSDSSYAFAKTDVGFQSGDETCAAWLYRPQTENSVPCVVMAHGFGATKEGGLAAYAERFAAAGFAVLVFDYRHFGSSGGEPRQLLEPRRQLADWVAAVSYARALEGVDPARIALWGSSFSGGHVIAIAARDRRIAAAVAQVPHASGPADVLAIGLWQVIRLSFAGVRDMFTRLSRSGPCYVKTVGPPGTLAAMTSPDAEPGYRAMFPAGLAWNDEVAARIFLKFPFYSPGRRAGRVRCPLLVQVGERDVVTPPTAAKKAARRATNGELIAYDIGHFDIYRGDPWERAVTDQLTFLNRVLVDSET